MFERYILIYTWCIVEVPNIGIWKEISKRKRKCTVPHILQNIFMTPQILYASLTRQWLF